ncbi:IS110 family transposase [Mesorhizobium sp. ASY16-5R]|uniref:IS110 family transposase n=1 Tax=Mesorhizobium sp. ASY16-5R TaxID=3445772 RepID=UPI003FA03554
MDKSSMKVAGIDTGKQKLDVALTGVEEQLTVDNDAAGHKRLSGWLRGHGAERVGIEASGGYESAVVAFLRAAGFTVIRFQPAQVRAYAGFRLQRAKNDRIDAALIAACAAVDIVHAAPDPRLEPLAEHLTLIDQIGEDIARFKTRREAVRDAQRRRRLDREIARLVAWRTLELKRLGGILRAHADLARRLELVMSVDGVGEPTAIAFLVRAPELGQIDREAAAAIVGFAPYDDDSGGRHGQRHVAGGRKRLARSVYAAALPAAFRWNAELIAFYKRLVANGKPHRVALVACARKLVIFVNTVLARGTPWVAKQAST